MFILVILLMTHDGEVFAAQQQVPMTETKCEAVGKAEAVRLAAENKIVMHICLPK